MSFENNKAILATTHENECINKWIQTLPDAEQSLFVVVPGLVNNKQTLILAPYGGKDGWEYDTRFTQLRDELVQLIESFNYEDGSNPFDYVEVSFGDFGQKIVRGNCVNRY